MRANEVAMVLSRLAANTQSRRQVKVEMILFLASSTARHALPPHFKTLTQKIKFFNGLLLFCIIWQQITINPSNVFCICTQEIKSNYIHDYGPKEKDTMLCISTKERVGV